MLRHAFEFTAYCRLRDAAGVTLQYDGSVQMFCEGKLDEEART
jgi:hypothetical protein